MTQAPFRPFESALPHDEALSILQSATAGAEDGELFVERRKSESLVFDDGRLKTASYDASEGFGLRAVQGEVAGYAHSTDVSIPALKRASETARLAVGDGGGTLAEAPMATNKRLYTDEDPIETASFPVKVETLREIDAFARTEVSRPMAATIDSAAALSVGASGEGMMQAATSSPRTSSGTGQTITMAIPGISLSAASTSSADIFSPERRITFLRRSTKHRVPSELRRTTSPV